MAMQAVYYRAPDGSQPVDEFIEALRDPGKQAALDNQIERLNMLRPNDPPLPFPWSSQLEGELRESCAATTAPSSTGCSTAGRGICSCCCTSSAKTAARCPSKAQFGARGTTE